MRALSKTFFAAATVLLLLGVVQAAGRLKGYKFVKELTSDNDLQKVDDRARVQIEDLQGAELLGAECYSSCPGWKLFSVSYLKGTSEIVNLKARLEL